MDNLKKRGRTTAQDKYDSANVETISFKTKKGARMRLKEAATATGRSTNGFIRGALNKAVQEATGQPMELEKEESENMPMPQNNVLYTYADYCTWDDSERWEIIEGVPYAMSPAPSQHHQEISSEIHRQLANFLKAKPCKVFHAPFDVRLNADDEDDTVCQPDLLVVCDSSKLDGKCCKGAPDLVIEILSPSTARHDRMVKFQHYQQAGVLEYWIIDPETKTVQACILQNGLYFTRMYADTDTALVRVLPGCEINLQDVFAE